MSVLYLLLPMALLFASTAVVVCVWAVRSGQYDDLETPAVRILHDDERDPGSGVSHLADNEAVARESLTSESVPGDAGDDMRPKGDRGA